MTLAEIRAELPAWEWAAKRYGMGWRYRGVKGERVVTVVSFSVLCGPGDDDSETVWMVEEGVYTVSYSYFRTHEACEETKE